MFRRSLVLAIALSAVTAQSAVAATVSSMPPGPEWPEICTLHLQYQAAPGEANYVMVEDAGTYIPFDPAFGPHCSPVVRAVQLTEYYAPLTAGPGCHQLTARTVACAVSIPFPAGSSLRRAAFALGDRDDSLLSLPGLPVPVNVDAGEGPDTVSAVNGQSDTIGCGPGVDGVEAERIDTVAPDCETVLRRR